MKIIVVGVYGSREGSLLPFHEPLHSKLKSAIEVGLQWKSAMEGLLAIVSRGQISSLGSRLHETNARLRLATWDRRSLAELRLLAE